MDKRFLLLVGVIGGAAAFAATRTSEPAPQPVVAAPIAPAPEQPPPSALPPGHPPLNKDLPSGHPPIGNAQLPKPEATLGWTMPPRWELIAHPSSMRIATYRVPKVPGDIEDAELSVTRAGGDVEQNAQRWIAQFDEPSRPSAKRVTKTIGTLKVHLVSVQGSYTSMKGEVEKDWAMIGAIVETGADAHFFKLTGPKKSVENARAELDALLASLKGK